MRIEYRFLVRGGEMIRSVQELSLVLVLQNTDFAIQAKTRLAGLSERAIFSKSLPKYLMFLHEVRLKSFKRFSVN